MRDLFLVAIAFTLGFFCGATEAQTTYLYGAQGQSLGTVQQSGNTQYFYGPQGQSLGTVMAPAVPMYNAPVYNPSSMTPIYDSIFER